MSSTDNDYVILSEQHADLLVAHADLFSVLCVCVYERERESVCKNIATNSSPKLGSPTAFDIF